MLSVVLGATAITTTTATMNRGEQETLFRQARNLRLLTEAKAQQQRQLLEVTQPRHIQRHSCGNIHQINTHPSALMQAATSCESVPCDDLLLSVLKSPLHHPAVVATSSSTELGLVAIAMGSAAVAATSTATTTKSHSSVLPSSPQTEYTNLENSEDDLVDDVESAMESTQLDISKSGRRSSSPRGFNFFRRFRRNSRFEAHHRRTPTPIKRKHRSRTKSRADILDGVAVPEPQGD